MTRPIVQSTLSFNGVSLNTPPLPPPPRATVASPPPRLTVACVWWGTLYGVEYVERLRNMVARHLTVPYDFVCITDNEVPSGVIRYPSPIRYKGWWQKVGLFSGDLFGRSQRVLYLDLDLVISGSLNKLVSAPEPFCMIENFGPNKGHAAHNSSVMLWTPSDESQRIYDCFHPDVTKHLHGDQCWIWRVMQDKIVDFPRSWVVSYKYERSRMDNRRGEDTAIVVFHGNPKPHQALNDTLVKNNWK